jgi:hypothetical protein
VTCPLPSFDDKDIKDLLKKFLIADRTKNNGIYIQKLTFTVDRLLKCESYHIENEDIIDDMKEILLEMADEVDTLNILQPIEFRSLKDI